ncbi:molybdopterin synthase sulfur carrier subunit-like [Nematostella vectensis]|uniref:molybdopterin synthase sulfur carrier subunit-like n=1 Tax=Nematostella vectensis TaxID=45351 RepID=UPI00138FD267|nr:molybdopterin synthase sulfur carrier subunit-like [Nematostella vectensis]
MDLLNNGTDSKVKVVLLFFAQSRELAEQKSAEISLPVETSREELLETITNLYPRISQIQNNIVLSVNQQYLEEECTVRLQTGDEIAVIPPISGG